MKYCDSCGKQIADSATFCPYCGNPTHKFLDTSNLPMLPHYEGIFGGRINRSRYFGGLGFAIFPLFVISMLWTIAITTPGVYGTFLYALLLALLVPGIVFSLSMLIGLTMRRLHDLGQSGLFSPLVFVPYVNLIVLIFLLSLRGDPKTNAYGPAPHPHRSPLDDFFNVDFIKADEEVERYSKTHEALAIMLVITIPLLTISSGLLLVLALSR